MKEHPILFNAPMVCAILDGSKTQTRRVVKNALNNNRLQLKDRQIHVIDAIDQSPFGQIGDQLWVRETHFINHFMGAKTPVEERADVEILYRATDMDYVRNMEDSEGLVWKPSIHMPRWASRIQLEIIGVRVERLQEIDEVDAKAEGFKGITKDGNLIKYGIPDRDGYPGTDNTGWPWDEWCVNPVNSYRKLWESINGAGSWDANPWVWVIEFRRAA